MSVHTKNQALALLVGGAFFMEQLDATIIAPAIPLIAKDLALDPLSLNLTLTTYLLALVVMIPVSGALADRFGTRTVFRWSVALFTLSSVLCAFAPDLPTLILARTLQGGSGALMVPVGRIAIVRTVKKSELVQALATMVTLAMVAPIVGPPLGGWIADTGSWTWIFLVNLPIGLLGWFLAGRHIPQLKTDITAPFDLPGWLALTSCLACLICGLELSRHGNIASWYAPTVFAASLGFGVLYFLRWRTQADPLLDFSLLKHNTFRVSFIGSSLVRVGYGALPFLLPLCLQLGLGFSASDSGLALLGSAVVVIIMKAGTAALLRTFGFRTVLICNGIACSAGLAICALLMPGWTLPGVLILLMAGGFARSVQFNALAAIAYADIEPSRTGAATSLNTMFQQLAVTLGITLSAWLLEWFATHAGRSELTAHDFALTFLCLAAITALAIPSYFALERHAGADLSGHSAPDPKRI
ncbi:MAG: MFS transporter [Curvibacter sp. PD_MW3]|nr:MAG: MFS transporter [Curvibacter sp. PD_MW3]